MGELLDVDRLFRVDKQLRESVRKALPKNFRTLKEYIENKWMEESGGGASKDTNTYITKMCSEEAALKTMKEYVVFKILEKYNQTLSYLIANYFATVTFSEFAFEVWKEREYTYEWLKTTLDRCPTNKKCWGDGFFVLSVYYRDFYKARQLDPTFASKQAAKSYNEYAEILFKKEGSKALTKQLFFNALAKATEAYAEMINEILNKEIMR